MWNKIGFHIDSTKNPHRGVSFPHSKGVFHMGFPHLVLKIEFYQPTKGFSGHIFLHIGQSA